MADLKKQGVYFVPIGGADDIGMNMFAYCSNGKWIVVDAGYGFLNDEYPGMDMCYASPKFLADFQEDIEGLFITHAHEDHMGAIAHIWPQLKCPVYGTDFALALVKERLKEYDMENDVLLNCVNDTMKVKLKEFEVEFISMVHSVPQTCGLFIKTKYQNIFHATDWRFDDAKTEMLKNPIEKLKQIGADGVDLFVCDSTNVLIDEHQCSEYDVRQSLCKIIPEIKGGLIVTCFASNLMRLESLLIAADMAQRTPVLMGKTLLTNMKIAKECGYFQNAPVTYSAEQAKDITSDKAMYICTGSQANYRSALSQIAKGESKYVTLSQNDTIIFSSKIIPGNEDKIEKMQEQMALKGVKIITEETDLVHTSGHASKEELKMMYQILKPKIVFPVHGDKRFIREHKRFALSCGVEDVCSGKNGDIFLLFDGKINKTEETVSDVMGVDRTRSVSLNSELVQNRRRIAYNCSLFISAVVSKDLELKDLQISSLDILEETKWKELSEEIQQKVLPLINAKLKECKCINSQVTDFIKGHIRKRILKATDIKPVTILHIYQEQ